MSAGRGRANNELHGNSRGPLVNAASEVIGMDTALISPTTGSVGLGFAQPSADVIFVTGRLIRDGWVRPGWVGSAVENVTPDLANALGMPSPQGSIITSLTNGSPAATAGRVVINGIAAGTEASTRGLSAGDAILRMQDGQVQTPEQVQAAIDAARAQHRSYVAALVLKKALGTPMPVRIGQRVSQP